MTQLKLVTDYTYEELSETTKRRIMVYAEHPEYIDTPTGRQYLQSLQILHPKAWPEIARILQKRTTGGNPNA